MNQNQIVQLFEQFADSKDQMAGLENLLNLSSQAIHLVKQVQSAPASEQKQLQAKLTANRNTLMVEFEQILSKLGMTKETAELFVQDPNNFSKEQWQQIQAFKKELDKETESKPSPVKKPRKNKLKNLRHLSNNWMSA